MSIECGAKARTNLNKPCRQPAMANGRCRLHGGKSTGPRTKEGRKRMKEANTKHGLHSAEMIQSRRHARDLIQESRAISREV
jgi:hypothetical protein